MFSYEKENIIALIVLKKEYAYILEFIIWSWYSFYIDNDGIFLKVYSDNCSYISVRGNKKVQYSDKYSR